MYKFVKVKPPFDIRKNFWEENFQISLIQPYKELYDRDRTDNKSVSSKELWCIWLSEDPSYENKIYRLSSKDKKSAILSYYSEFDFNDPIIAECLTSYMDNCLSPAAKSFRIEEASLSKRAEFIDNAKYSFPEVVRNEKGAIVYVAGRPAMTPGTVKDIEAMRKVTLDIFKKYNQVRLMFEEEQNEARLYGGGKETLIERGGLLPIDDD